MDFAFFIILNGVLLIRPEDLLPEVAGLRLYMTAAALCTVAALPRLLLQASPHTLAERPVAACVLCLPAAMALSLATAGKLALLPEQLGEFAKVVLYFLLFQAVVHTPQRVVAFLGWLVAFVVALTALGLLQYHGYVDLESLRPVEQREYDPDTGEVIRYPRLCSSGIYSDPNDLCLILVTGTVACLARAGLARGAVRKVAWLAPIALFCYAMMLTRSRGGLLGLLAALSALFYARLGLRRSLPLLAVALPAVLALFGGRQTNFNTGGEDTAQDRFRLWAEGLALLPSHPLFGIGAGQYPDEVGMVAHNSFVEAFVETGLPGGTLFLGAFYLALDGLRRVGAAGWLDREPTLRALRPYVFGIVAGYAAGCFSLSRNWVVPTYMVLGLASSFLALALPRSPWWFCVNGRLLGRVAAAGVLGLILLKAFTQVMANYG